jgi:hypothetical protein
VSYGGPFQSGVLFEVTTSGMWFQGYWWWVCPTQQSTSSQKFALWCVTGGASGQLVPGSVVTAGSLTAGQWNWVPLATPLPLAIGTCYNACTGFTGSFPNTSHQYGSGNPYGSGIVTGPLSAYSDLSGSLPSPYKTAQGVFSITSSDPSAHMPASGSSSDNFWMDVQVSDTAPPQYGGSYRVWPNKYDAGPMTSGDAAVNYVVATEVHLSQQCVLNNIWYYSPPNVTQLATECGVWDISTRKLVITNNSPSWSGAPGSGWVSCAFPGPVLAEGNYRVAVYNGAANPAEWNPKQLNYWDTGIGKDGITNGPVYAPGLAQASLAKIYQKSGQEPGQCVFAVGPPNQYPNEYVDGLAQNYWVDMEVTPATGAPVNPPPVNSGAFLNFFP